jgi:hypothetical protein
VGVAVGVTCHHVQAVTASKINKMGKAFIVFLLITIRKDAARNHLVPIFDANSPTTAFFARQIAQPFYATMRMTTRRYHHVTAQASHSFPIADRRL